MVPIQAYISHQDVRKLILLSIEILEQEQHYKEQRPGGLWSTNTGMSWPDDQGIGLGIV